MGEAAQWYLGRDCLIKGNFPASDQLPEGGEGCVSVYPTDMLDSTKDSGGMLFLPCDQIEAKWARWNIREHLVAASFSSVREAG